MRLQLLVQKLRHIVQRNRLVEERFADPAHMLHDKKMDAGTLPFVLLRGIGEAFLDKAVSLDDVAEFLDEQLQAH